MLLPDHIRQVSEPWASRRDIVVDRKQPRMILVQVSKCAIDKLSYIHSRQTCRRLSPSFGCSVRLRGPQVKCRNLTVYPHCTGRTLLSWHIALALVKFVGELKIKILIAKFASSYFRHDKTLIKPLYIIDSLSYCGKS